VFCGRLILPEARHVAQPSHIRPVPEGTVRVAQAAFRKGNPLLRLRDELGSIVATVAAINLDRLVAWFQATPRAAARTSRFAAALAA
jgi:hypothetical protein